MRDVSVLVQRSGLHPGIGLLHGARDAHPGCAADLIEEFRAPLSEGLTAYLINNRIIQLDDFSTREDKCTLRSEASSSLVRHYESWMSRPIYAATMGRKISWKKLVGEQIRQFTLHLQGRAEYHPYLMSY
jgi:CRISPR-associated protein Cas1